MFRIHLNYWVEQSRIITDMLSLDRNLGLEFTSFGIAYGIWMARSTLGFTCGQHTKRSMRSVEIMSFGIYI